MKLSEGRGLLPAVLACALCLVWSLGPAVAQETGEGGAYVGDSDRPARLGPKPKPLHSNYIEPAAPPASPSSRPAKSTKARKRPKADSAASASQPAPPKLVKGPKPRAKARTYKPVKQVEPAKPAKTAKRIKPIRQAAPPKQVKAPKAAPRAAVAPPAKISTRAVQQALNRAGHPAPLDGKLGKKTRQALRNFQRAHGLPATGQADRHTLARLGLI